MALATANPETSVVDIPFLIHGQVIQPGDDAVNSAGGSAPVFARRTRPSTPTSSLWRTRARCGISTSCPSMRSSSSSCSSDHA